MIGPDPVASTPLPNATNDVLALPHVQGLDAGLYSVTITNAVSSARASATLIVNVPPSISSQPRSQTVSLGGTAMFTVAALGSGPFSFQWRLNGIDLAGAVADSLVLAKVQRSAAGNYSVVISNAAQSVSSDLAALQVNVPITILQQPQDANVIAGSATSLMVAADGVPPLLYQWLFNGAPLTNATNISLDLPNAQVKRQHSCEVDREAMRRTIPR